jgi:hypothetical protein
MYAITTGPHYHERQDAVHPPAVSCSERQEKIMSDSESDGVNDAPVEREATKMSGAAIASLILGLLSFCLAIFASIPALILGIVALLRISRSDGRLRGTRLAVTGIVCSQIGPIVLGVVLALPAVMAAREAARRSQSMANMHQIGSAMINFQEARRDFPAAGMNAQGETPNVGWRVQILPYVGERPLYDEFRPSIREGEPWDSEQNKRLIHPMPNVYRNPNGDIEPPKTNYLAVIGQETMFSGSRFSRHPSGRWRYRGPTAAHIRDGLAHTVMIVEADADQAAVWASPDDWVFDPKNPKRGLGSYRPGGFLAVFADGQVRFISNDVNDEILSAAMTRAGGERFDLDDLSGQRAGRK